MKEKVANVFGIIGVFCLGIRLGILISGGNTFPLLSLILLLVSLICYTVCFFVECLNKGKRGLGIAILVIAIIGTVCLIVFYLLFVFVFFIAGSAVKASVTASACCIVP